MTTLDRFMDKVDKTDSCWLWIGHIGRHCYGTFAWSRDEKSVLAHRAAWRLFRGDIPDNMCVLHTCDVKDCVNPNHLYLGTQRENMQDAYARGQKIGGERSPVAKLSEQQVKSIRTEYAAGGTSYRKLATKYNVGDTSIREIVNRRIWQHVV